ncbi:MAG: aminopeptidase P family protein [Acidobacteria bacterium]|nr:aminopeptidase P family protein [Acidobacteriota bacterium]
MPETNLKHRTIRKTNLARRNLLKSGLLAGATALTAPTLACNVSKVASSQTRMPEPPEAKMLDSKEYGQGRIRRVQEAIKKSGLDALIISNRALDYLGYVSNFHPSSLQIGVAFIPAEGAPTLYIQMYSSVHARTAKKTIWIEDVVDVPKDPVSESSSLNFYQEVINKLKDLKLTRGRIGLAGGEVDWMLPYYFRSELSELRVEDANPMLWSLVIVKDDVELAFMRHAQKIIDEVVYPQYQKSAVVGALDADAQFELLSAMLKAGVDIRNSSVSFGAAPYSSGTWAGPVANRRIQKGDIILSEPIPYVKRYNVEKMFTFAVGKDIPESQKRGAQVIYESFLMALDELKPGREMRSIFEKCNNFIKSKGYEEGSTVLIGHWIGAAGARTSHEGARITSEGTQGLILQPGMVLSWHPNVVVPGEVRTCCSACLLITEKGVESLSKIPMEPLYYV